LPHQDADPSLSRPKGRQKGWRKLKKSLAGRAWRPFLEIDLFNS
jgi:hypothetical protein